MGKTGARPSKSKSTASSAALPTLELSPSNRPEYRAVHDAFMKGQFPTDMVLREYHEKGGVMSKSFLKGLALYTREERTHWNKIANEYGYRLHCLVDPDTAELLTTAKFEKTDDSSDDASEDSSVYENGAENASPTDVLHSRTPAREKSKFYARLCSVELEASDITLSDLDDYFLDGNLLVKALILLHENSRVKRSLGDWNILRQSWNRWFRIFSTKTTVESKTLCRTGLLEQAGILLNPDSEKWLGQTEWDRIRRCWYTQLCLYARCTQEEKAEDEDAASDVIPVTTPQKRSADSLESTPKRQRLSSPSRETPASTKNPASDHAGIAPSKTRGNTKLGSKSIAATSPGEGSIAAPSGQRQAEAESRSSLAARARADGRSANTRVGQATAGIAPAITHDDDSNSSGLRDLVKHMVEEILAEKKADALVRKRAKAWDRIKDLETEIARLKAKWSESSSRTGS